MKPGSDDAMLPLSCSPPRSAVMQQLEATTVFTAVGVSIGAVNIVFTSRFVHGVAPPLTSAFFASLLPANVQLSIV